jgi:archaellum component FlaF (FlaF/FlaG flagellin family)
VVDPIFREGKVSYVHRPLLNEKYDSFHTFLYVCYTYFYECTRNIKEKVKYVTKDQLNDDVNNIINSYVMTDPNSEVNTGFNYKFQWLLVSNVFPLFQGPVSFNLTSTNFMGQDATQTIITSNRQTYKILKLVSPMDNRVRLLLFTPNNPGGELVGSIRQITELIRREHTL